MRYCDQPCCSGLCLFSPTGDKNALMADAMCHSKIFWKHFTFGSSEFHVWFTPWFPEGLEIMTFFFIYYAIYGI